MTTRELVQRARLSCDPKRTLSVQEMDRWLHELAAAGVIVRDGDDWRPTPIGQGVVEPGEEGLSCFPAENEVASFERDRDAVEAFRHGGELSGGLSASCPWRSSPHVRPGPPGLDCSRARAQDARQTPEERSSRHPAFATRASSNSACVPHTQVSVTGPGERSSGAPVLLGTPGALLTRSHLRELRLESFVQSAHGCR